MTDDTASISTLSREDSLTLECQDTDEEIQIQTYIVDVSDDEDADYSESDTDTEPDQNDEEPPWISDEQVATWEAVDALWRNPDAYYYDIVGYDVNGEI
jgi:hypothetical protein